MVKKTQKDMNEMTREVRPFLFNKKDEKKVLLFLKRLSNPICIEIHICHFPRAASKWKKIAHSCLLISYL